MLPLPRLYLSLRVLLDVSAPDLYLKPDSSSLDRDSKQSSQARSFFTMNHAAPI